MSQQSLFQSSENSTQGGSSSPNCDPSAETVASSQLITSPAQQLVGESNPLTTIDNDGHSRTKSQIDDKATYKTPISTEHNLFESKSCGNVPAVTSNLRSLRQKRQNSRMRTYRQRERLGQCRQCGFPLVAPDKRTTCEPCTQKHSLAFKALRNRRKNSGLCSRCEFPATDKFALCVRCREKARIYNKNSRLKARALSETFHLEAAIQKSKMPEILEVGQADQELTETET
ncbi:hypothetical protein F5Y12DRAFT_713236 [Xylaria sp. FL1777]|nr:hypothetical protein F5Y12DRAFT_713236 [Xylaria sp. FL1777]